MIVGEELRVNGGLIEVAEYVVALLAEAYLVDHVTYIAVLEHVASVFARVSSVRKALHVVEKPVDDVAADKRCRYGDLEPVAVAHIQARVERGHGAHHRFHIRIDGQIELIVGEAGRVTAVVVIGGGCCDCLIVVHHHHHHLIAVVLMMMVVGGHVVAVVVPGGGRVVGRRGERRIGHGCGERRVRADCGYGVVQSVEAARLLFADGSFAALGNKIKQLKLFLWYFKLL